MHGTSGWTIIRGHPCQEQAEHIEFIPVSHFITVADEGTRTETGEGSL